MTLFKEKSNLFPCAFALENGLIFFLERTERYSMTVVKCNQLNSCMEIWAYQNLGLFIYLSEL